MRPGGLRYAPGLDGVRALAVLSVFVYHLGATGNGEHLLQGGFLGVDVFFVLSGYLITSLLLVELGDTRRISLGRFYLRRARRLLPALFGLLITVAAIGAFWLPQQAARIRGDVLASLGYVMNWWLIAQESSYFGTGERPPLLTHLWSLAVEEQFYLLWPLLLIVFAVGARGRKAVLVVLAVLILASTVAAWMLYDPFADPSRVYYGTDTRAATPLLGAALAALVRPWRQRKSGNARGLDLLGLGSLLGLGVIAVLLDDRDQLLYQGGFLVIALLAGGLVVAAGHPATLLGDLLGKQPLRWLGQRSYAFYLWHWPVCVLTRPQIDVPLTGWANAALRLALTLLLAEISFWLLERPVREGFIFRWRGPAPRRAATAAVTVFAVLAATGVGATLNITAQRAVFVMGEGPIDQAPDVSIEVAVTVPIAQAPRTPPVKVAIFGDSQGRALFTNRPADIGKYLTLTDNSINACGILPGKVRSSSGEGFDLVKSCPRWAGEWAGDAMRVKPEIALVVIGAWDVFDLTTAQGKLTFASPEWDALFSSTLAAAIASLRASGAVVALSLLPCYSPVRVTGGAGYWPERGEAARVQHVNQLLTRATGPGVHAVTPPAQFCTDPVIGKDRKLRWDGVHYLKTGSALYFGAVVPQLLALPS